jgi:hypothetical protein
MTKAALKTVAGSTFPAVKAPPSHAGAIQQRRSNPHPSAGPLPRSSPPPPSEQPPAASRGPRPPASAAERLHRRTGRLRRGLSCPHHLAKGLPGDDAVATGRVDHRNRSDPPSADPASSRARTFARPRLLRRGLAASIPRRRVNLDGAEPIPMSNESSRPAPGRLVGEGRADRRRSPVSGQDRPAIAFPPGIVEAGTPARDTGLESERVSRRSGTGSSRSSRRAGPSAA